MRLKRPDVELTFAGLRRHPVLLCGPDYAETLARLGRFFEVEVLASAAALDAAEFASRLAGKSGLLATRTPGVDAMLLATLPSLKAVCKAGPSHADIDLDACTRAGVIATNTPDMGRDEAALRQMSLVAAECLIAAFGFGRAAGHPPHILNAELLCMLGCCY